MILITGAAGMIGSGIVRHLNDQGRTDLILVDDFKHSDKWKNLVGKKFLTIVSRHELFNWLKGRESEISAIIHMGACSDTIETNADYLLENNYRFTIRLAQWALEDNIPFIYASSAATYGDGAQGFNDDHIHLDSLRPLNMYGYSKHLVDLWMQRENVLDRVVGLKYFNVFGPNEYHKGRMASMVLKMTQIVQNGQPIQLFKSNDPKYDHGAQMRDFIYVKDAVQMTCSFLNSKASGIFNIGQGNPTTWNELAFALFQSVGLDPRINYVDMPADLSRQYQNYTCSNMGKFLNLYPKHRPTSIKDAVHEYVNHYLLKEARW